MSFVIMIVLEIRWALQIKIRTYITIGIRTRYQIRQILSGSFFLRHVTSEIQMTNNYCISEKKVSSDQIKLHEMTMTMTSFIILATVISYKIRILAGVFRITTSVRGPIIGNCALYTQIPIVTSKFYGRRRRPVVLQYGVLAVLFLCFYFHLVVFLYFDLFVNKRFSDVLVF